MSSAQRHSKETAYKRASSRGLGDKGHFFSRNWGSSLDLVGEMVGAIDIRKSILGSCEERAFFFQGAKTPPRHSRYGLIKH